MRLPHFSSPTFARVAPFAVFMAFIALEQGLRALVQRDILDFSATLFVWLYLPKALLTALVLVLFWRHYSEIILYDLRAYGKTALSISAGLLIFFLWINMDWTLGGQPDPPGFNPGVLSTTGSTWLMIAVRVAGAVIVVPIMEELFWRSFLLRYLIDSDFTRIAIGRFTLLSFAAVAILFGLEHHYVFAGIMAGIIFNVLCYTTKSIIQCILAHAVANLALAWYTIATGQWHFW